MQSVNSYVTAEGNFNYGIATHPYNVPLYNTQTWNPSIKNSVTQSPDTMYITMANIGVLTDFFCQKENLQTDGQVRSILCSEVGYTSIPFGGYVSDENQQAAALAFGYLQAANNQHIDGFFNREVDAPEEIASSGLAMGVLTTGDYVHFTPKMAYNTYKFIDDPGQQAAYVNAASAAIGRNVLEIITPR